MQEVKQALDARTVKLLEIGAASREELEMANTKLRDAGVLEVFDEVGTFRGQKVAHIWHTNRDFCGKIAVARSCKLLKGLEAAIGIEPMNKGFADLCLTTWLRRPNAGQR